MGEYDLVATVRDIAIDAVNAVSKPVSIQVAKSLGGNKICLAGGLEVEAKLSSIFTEGMTSGDVTVKMELNEGDSAIVVKQDGANIYYVLGKL